VAIWITVWIQGLFSGFVTIGRYGKWLLTDNINLLVILIRQQWLTDLSAADTESPDGGTG